MKPLTDAQHQALGRSRSKSGVAVSGPRLQANGKRAIPEGHIGPQTANVLLAGGFARMIDGTLRATREGHREFDKPRPEGPPIYLAIGGGIKYKTLPSGRQVEDRDGVDSLSDHGYTTSRSHSADELETMDPSLLHPDWKLRAEAHRKLSRADLDAARLSGLHPFDGRVAELKRIAAERGKDIRSDLRQLEHVVRRIERKVTNGDEEAA